MGARQSKRSVDITTGKEVLVEGSDVAAAGGEGKLERIEDLDALKPQLNGGAAHQDMEISDKEKKMQQQDEAPENEKDTNNEKEIILSPVTINGGSGEGEEAKEAGEGDAAQDAPEVDSNKKPKKEKVKKKWSFRSISFSKKDKQKPPKKEESNGECDKVPEEAADATPVAAAGEAVVVKTDAQVIEDTPKVEEAEKVAEKAVEIPAEPLTNGASESPKEKIRQNGEPAPEEKPAETEAAEPAQAAPEQIPVEVPLAALSLEEPAPAAPQAAAPAPAPAPVAVSEPAPEALKSEVVAAVPETILPEPAQEQSPAVPAEAEVCVAKESPDAAGSVEIAPPPLPASPPPSSLTVFAESTMAPTSADDAPVSSLASPAQEASGDASSELVCAIKSVSLSTASPINPASGEDVQSSPSLASKIAESLSEANTPSAIPVEATDAKIDNLPSPVDKIAVVPSDEVSVPPPSDIVVPPISEAVLESPPLPVDPVVAPQLPEPLETVISDPIICICPMPPMPSESTETSPVIENIVSTVASPPAESSPVVSAPVVSAPVVSTPEDISPVKSSVVESSPVVGNLELQALSVKEAAEVLPVEETPSPVANDTASPIMQRESSDPDISETTLAEPPSDSFPPPPPPESCPESMTEISISESLPPPLSEFSIPDNVLNSPTSEMAELPSKDQASPVAEVKVEDVKDRLETEVNGTELSQPDVSIALPAEPAAAIPEQQAPCDTPQVKSVCEIVDAPVIPDVPATEAAFSVDAEAE